METKLATLKKRAEFQRVRGGGRATAPGFILEGKRRADTTAVQAEPSQATQGPRFGFTITRKIGNAVKRNRIRRRLRAALTRLAGQTADPATDYVVVARGPAADQDFKALVADLKRALERVHAGGDSRKSVQTRGEKRTK